MKRIVFLPVIIFPLLLHAQLQLTLQSAVDTALRNNFDIQIARNNAEIDKISNTYGMAGGLPSINASAGDNGSLSHVSQKNTGAPEVVLPNVNSNTANAGISAGMTLYNGMKIIAAKERLNALQKQSESQLNFQIQSTVAAVMLKYYDIVRQEKYLKIIESLRDVSQKKLDIINQRNAVGMSNAAEVLQARMDLNNTEQNISAQQLIIDQDKTDLMQLMSVKKFVSLNVTDSIMVDRNIRLESVISSLDGNPQYISASQQVRINEQIVREVSSQRYPSLKLSAGYYFSNTGNSQGTTLLSQEYGPSAGLSLQIPIFNGNVFKIQRESAILEVKNANLERESLMNSLIANAIKIYQSYDVNLQQISTQQKNFEMAQKLVNVVMKNFSLNQATIVDVKEAQSSFEEAAYMLVNLRFAAKSAEIGLKQLSFQLKY